VAGWFLAPPKTGSRTDAPVLVLGEQWLLPGARIMYRYLATSAVVFSALASPAHAQVSIDVARITCDQYVHSKITTPNYIAVWISGYYNGKRNNLTLDPEEMQKNVGKLERYCYDEKNFKVPVLKAVEELFGKGKR
jgi:hypothetical protein